MSKVAQYLQEHVAGEVMTSADALRYFSTDASSLAVKPNVIVYPRNEQDVRKVARFAWQLAERGRALPITARGSGTDLAGAALGSGVLLVFPAHLNRIVEFDPKNGIAVVEPGLNYGRLQQTLHTHGRFVPPFPMSYEYSTIGGAVANNAGGEKSLKYGSTRGFVKGLHVVLSNGEVITTERLGKRELSKKLGLATLEGEIYRQLDALLEENRELVEKLDLPVTKNVAGYDLLDIKRLDGSFDLTPLFVGSQGTLGIITEITLDTEVYNTETDVFLAEFDSLENVQKAVTALRAIDGFPSAIELVDQFAIDTARHLNPNLLGDLVAQQTPAAVLLVEFDDDNKTRKKYAKKAEKILAELAANVQHATEPEEQARLRKVRDISATIIADTSSTARAVPVAEDGVVPPSKLAEFIEGVYTIFKNTQVRPAIWGHAGDANLHVMPLLDLAQVGDRQKVFRLMDECHRLVISLGGSLTGQNGDGRMRAPYIAQLYGEDVANLFRQVKQIFDPHNLLNPGVKVGGTIDDIKHLLGNSYNLSHLYDHMPRS